MNISKAVCLGGLFVSFTCVAPATAQESSAFDRYVRSDWEYLDATKAAYELGKMSMSFAVEDGDERIEIRVADGAVTVQSNGASMPAERVETAGETTIVLDVRGRPVLQLTGVPAGATLQLLPRQPPRRRLGVIVEQPSEALAEHLQLDPEQVLYVSSVVGDGPAARAGVRKHDIIVSLNGERSVNRERLQEVLRSVDPDTAVEVAVVRRGGAQKTIAVVPEEDAVVQWSRYRSLPGAGNGYYFADPNSGLPGQRVGAGGEYWRLPGAEKNAGQGLRYDAFWGNTTGGVGGLSGGGAGQFFGGADDKELETKIEKLEARLAELQQLLEKALAKTGTAGGGQRSGR